MRVVGINRLPNRRIKMNELHREMLDLEMGYPGFEWISYGLAPNPAGYCWEWDSEEDIPVDLRDRANVLADTAPGGYFRAVDVTPEFSLSK